MNLPLITIEGIPLFEAAFTAKPEQYYVLEHGKWRPYSEKNFTLRLRRSGLSRKIPSRADLSSVEDALHQVQVERQVDMALPLAGYPAGIIMSAGRRVLVTESAKVLPAEDVPWPNLKKFLTELLGEEALPYQLLWWKCGRMNIGNPLMLPSQVIFYIGASSVGKSLLQKSLTTPLLGGLSGDPYDAMTCKSNFNSDLFEATHLVIEDREFGRSISARRAFGASIKQMAVCTIQRCHPKGKPGVMLTPKWRTSISLNSEPENLSAIPPLDDSILDKLMIFRCSRPDYPCDMGTSEGWEQWNAIMHEELPGLAYHCDQMDFGQFAAPRYGVKAWHDPVIMAQVKEVAPESILLEIIRNDLPRVTNENNVWEGTSTDLCRVLCGTEMPSYRQVQKILGNYSVQNCGTFLGKLAVYHPAIAKRTIKGTNHWRINLGELK